MDIPFQSHLYKLHYIEELHKGDDLRSAPHTSDTMFPSFTLTYWICGWESVSATPLKPIITQEKEALR